MESIALPTNTGLDFHRVYLDSVLFNIIRVPSLRPTNQSRRRMTTFIVSCGTTVIALRVVSREKGPLHVFCKIGKSNSLVRGPQHPVRAIYLKSNQQQLPPGIALNGGPERSE